MPRRRLTAAICLVLALAMMLGGLFLPRGPSSSHDPVALAAAEAARHAELAQELATHGHVHDDGDWDEQAPGHTHGHDPGDHTHDQPATMASAAPDRPPAARRWPAPSLKEFEPGPALRQERPPKASIAA